MNWKSWCEQYDCEPHEISRMLYLVIINNAPHFIGERRLFLHRDYRLYFCNLWCFITNQRLCRKPNRLANRQARQQIREYIDARAAQEEDEW